MASPTMEAFASHTLVVLVADLDGYARLFRTHPDQEMARFLDRYYALADEVITHADGHLVKFIGDSVLATFGKEDTSAAVAAALALRNGVETLGKELGLPVRMGANLHLGPVVDAELGRDASRRRDVVGRTVNQTFLLGRGAGIRLSEPVYRKLPSGERSPWSKNKPPAVYFLEDDSDALTGLRRAAGENAVRW